jgi:hypothetical protein
MLNLFRIYRNKKFYRWLEISFFFLFFLFSKAHASSTSVGNGGDSVKCAPIANNSFRGLYSLDYLLTYSESTKNSDIVQIYDWESSYQRISQILKKFPDLDYSFQEFVQDIGNQSDPTRPKIWHESAFGLVDIKDERIIRKVPSNCYKQKDDQAIDVMQTVIRTERADATIYEFDPQILGEFQEFAPLQYSFLLIHEWLWDLTQDVQVIRDINRFLHSEAAQKMNADQFRLAILRLGLDFRVKEFFNVCNRTLVIRDLLVDGTGKACEDIQQSDLIYNPVTKRDGVHHLVVSGNGISSFKLGDFSGLGKLKSLTLSHLQLRHIYESQFDTTNQISKLLLDHNELTFVPLRLFEVLDALYELNISHNKISKIPSGAFFTETADSYVDKKLNLSHNLIQKLEIGANTSSKKYGRFSEIDLSYNSISEIPSNLCEIIAKSANRPFINLSNNPLSDAAKVKIKSLPCANWIGQ